MILTSATQFGPSIYNRDNRSATPNGTLPSQAPDKKL